jgi:hypothetical protein
MRLRVTIVTTLALGILMSGTGAGLAFQGLGQTGDNAGVAQYGGAVDQQERLGGEGGGGVLGQSERSPGPAGGRVQSDRVLGVAQPIDVQPARQVEAGSSLPFTGFAAIPLLLLGASLLTTGLILRRNAARGD